MLAFGCSSLPTVSPRPAADAGADAPDAACDGAACACGRPCGDGVECIGGVCSRRVVQLSSELSHTCARLVDGSVWCWGNNEHGEVGDGSPESTRPVPSRVPGLVATIVAAGWSHSCAVVDGRVRCWGENANRVIADDARTVVPAPEEVPLPGRTVALALGYGSCALSDEGVVNCRPMFGNEPALPYRRWADRVVSVDNGWGHACALRDDGTVACGGRQVRGAVGDGVPVRTNDDAVFGPVQPVGLPRVTALASSAEGNCAIADGGALWCWGAPFADRGDMAVPLPVRMEGVGPVRELWSRGHGFVVRDADGVLRAWGENTTGGVGDGTTTYRWPPVPVTALGERARDVVSIAGGVEHVCALLNDQTVRCWGGNVRGQIGNGSLSARVMVAESPRW